MAQSDTSSFAVVIWECIGSLPTILQIVLYLYSATFYSRIYLFKHLFAVIKIQLIYNEIKKSDWQKG